ncbi:MAG TPA: alpha/beta hydrolase [Opitutaceae bacterium]|nr:alpha/beta hydrolase [Opitutaceae bacterium]
MHFQTTPVLASVLVVLSAFGSIVSGSAATPAAQPSLAPAESPPPPTETNVRYGPHERQVLDFWRAPSERPTPLVFHIHGGGWVTGDKAKIANVQSYLDAGISVVSINYRYVSQAIAAGVQPPVQWPLEDAARALQFVRSKAKVWNLEKARVIATGGSAGACSSLWLAMNDDRADPTSSDPIARESTRLESAAVDGAQTTLDPAQMIVWTPNSRYGGHAFGFWPDAGNLKTRDTAFAEFLRERARVLPWIKQYSPMALVTPDDPPVYLIYKAPPALGQDQKDPTHTANFGVKFQEELRSRRIPCELVYPGAPNVTHPETKDYILATLKSPPKRR